jgi:hypothetical protein
MLPIAFKFDAPDNPPDYTPYACSYHWFRGPDGRVLSLDVIRSHDSGQLGLRVLRERADGGVDGLSLISPIAEWAPMRTDGSMPDAEDVGRPALSRGRNFVAGQVTGGQGNLRRVSFALAVNPKAPGLGPGSLALEISRLSVTDYTRVRYLGFVEIDGERIDIDAPGVVSLHYGDSLPHYAYVVSVPQLEESAARLLLSSVRSDTIRYKGELLGDCAVTYAYGTDGLPPVSIFIGEFTRTISVGFGARVELSDLRPFFHDFIDEPTCTASALARYIPALGSAIDLGRVFIDYRGRDYLATLGLDEAPR